MRALAAFLISLLPLPAIAATIPRFTNPDRRAKLMAALPEIQSIFERYQQQRGVPGLVYGVVIDGETVAIKALGVRERSSNDPVTPATMFRIASMTKSFTALAILELRDGGKLSLEDSVSKWIPEFARMHYPTNDTAPIRIRELLTHGAGFPEDNPWGDRQLAASDETVTRWLEQGLPFSTPPDTAFEYSNYGFALLGRIVAKASGTTYRDYLDKHILAPLGMTSSTLEGSTISSNLRATGYGRTAGDYTEIPALAHGAFGSMGGLWTNAQDLGRYVAFHLAAYPPRDGDDPGPVRRSSVREMERLARFSTFRVDRTGPDATLRAVAGGYGYGLSVSRDCRFNHIVAHGGGLPGFGSYMEWLPDYGVGLFAMANLTYAGPAAPIDEALDLLRRTGALAPRQLPPSPALESMREAIVHLWQHWDDAEAERIAAGNFFLDATAVQRRTRIEKLKSEMGACRPEGNIQPENLLRGKFRLACDQGFVDVSFTLAPTAPPTLQSLAFVPAHRMDASLAKAARTLAARFGGPDAKHSGVPDEIDRRIHLLAPLYGSCGLGELIAGDGKSSARLRLDCARAALDMDLRTGAQGKILEATFSRPPESSCVQ